MRHYRRTTSFWLICQALCFSLLLQGTGIAQALPLPPKKLFVSKSELEPPQTKPDSNKAAEAGSLARFEDSVRSSAEEAGDTIRRWLQDRWLRATDDAPVRIAQAGGILPLPPRLISFFLTAPNAQGAPPNPPGLAGDSAEDTPPAEIASLLEKAGADEIPLLAGWNLISIPEEPADPAPAAVFGPIAGQTARVEAFDACDLADPWKIYDPAAPTASDLTVVDHEIGMWVKASSAAILPTGGTLPATTTIDLCEGWNLIGFPAGEPRHPHAALSSIAGKWQRIFGYDAFDSQDPWEVFSVDVPDWANDLRLMRPGRGYWVLATEAVTLEIRNEGPPPTVAIASPADLAVITQPTEIIGTVESDRLDSWTLTYRPIGDGDAVTLATSKAPVSGGTLGTFDPTLLLNGLYAIELTATDVQGQQVSESIAVAVEGQMKIGHFTLSFVDLAIPVSGLDIEIVRTYDSRDKQQRDFGVGWSLDIRQGSYRNNRAPGDGWQLQDGFVACDTALESKSHLTVVRLSDQEVYRFALRLVRGAPRNGGGCSATAEFVYVDGPIPGASLAILGNDQVFQEIPSSNRVLDPDTFATYEPQQVRLTTRDGRIFEIDLNNGVTLVEDLNGHQLSITPAGITHSSGKGIVFERDPEGRIERITDPMDRGMTYGYDTAGDLVSFTDREDDTSRYFYDGEHLLEEIEDPRRIRPIRNEYDDDGRLKSVTDAFGKTLSLDHDLDAKREVITNRLGHVRVLEYDARGNVIREVDENQKVTLREYDAEDNLTKQIDPLLHATNYFYDGNNDLRRLVDPEQNETRFTYNSRGQILTTTDPRGKVTENRYDTRGNLEYIKDPTGAETVLTYYPSGLLHTQTDAEFGLTTYEYDTSGFGNQTRVTDALGHVTDSTYDANGNRLTETTTRTLADSSTETLVTTFIHDDLDRVTQTIYPDGTSTKTRYDSLGKVAESTDQRQRKTLFHYDDLGRLERTDYQDETTEERIYDAEGQLLTLKDRADRLTTFEYDPVGRQTKTTFPDLKYTINRYDDAGRLTEFENARRYVTRYFYDDADRRTKIIDALDGVFDFEYDPAGNQTAVVDANRHRTEFEHDDVGRLVRTILPGPVVTDRHITYDDLGRRTSETDQADKTTEFRYDKLGRLLKVIDALQQETEYVYDELGNRTQQIDANGHVTRFEYDALGRTIKRILPGDSKFEVMTYYADGTLKNHTDFNGATRTFEYDTDRRLTRRAYPDGSAVTFTYTPTGQRETATDARGTTTYTYDDRDRLTLKVDPTGYSLGYGYDDQSNRTRLTATVGAEVYNTTYTYDELDRMATVTDGQSGVTTLGYDSNGNRTSLAHPNGVTTGYTYNKQNRLKNLSTATSVGDVLASYAYTLGPAGYRTRIDEHDGTSRHYIYDDLYRLTQDRVTDVTAAQVYQRDFVYDPVGNRLQQLVDDGGEPTPTASSYDDRDRLLTADTALYGWDNNGNLVTKADGGIGVAAFDWDFENRLTTISLDSGITIETVYDADGNRVRTTVNPSTSTSYTVDYLVDSEGLLSHVVAEVATDQVETLYTRAGDQLISLARPASAAKRFFLFDGLGSVRMLANHLGSITDRYDYTAFGETLEHVGSDLQPYNFAGEPFEPNSGFYYNRARWMDPETGRFVGVDPFSGFARQPISLHKYLYAAAQPVILVDPSGLFTGGLSELGIAGAIRGMVTHIQVDVGLNILTLPPLDPKGDISKALLIFALAAGGRSLVKGVVSILSSLTRTLASLPRTLRKVRFDRVFRQLRMLIQRMRTPRAKLPLNVGGKTHGVLHIAGDDPLPLVSGIKGPSEAVRGKGLPGFNNIQLTHVEGHAAAHMRTTGKKHAILDINKAPCDTTSGGGCDGLLPRMLPEDAILIVRHPDDVKAYIGLPDP